MERKGRKKEKNRKEGTKRKVKKSGEKPVNQESF